MATKPYRPGRPRRPPSPPLTAAELEVSRLRGVWKNAELAVLDARMRYAGPAAMAAAEAAEVRARGDFLTACYALRSGGEIRRMVLRCAMRQEPQEGEGGTCTRLQ